MSFPLDIVWHGNEMSLYNKIEYYKKYHDKEKYISIEKGWTLDNHIIIFIYISIKFCISSADSKGYKVKMWTEVIQYYTWKVILLLFFVSVKATINV